MHLGADMEWPCLVWTKCQGFESQGSLHKVLEACVIRAQILYSRKLRFKEVNFKAT